MGQGSRFLRDRGGWEDRSTIVRKGRGIYPLSLLTTVSQKPLEFRHKLSFIGHTHFLFYGMNFELMELVTHTSFQTEFGQLHFVLC